MIALDLLQQLHKLGVILTPNPDGTLHCRAPKGVLTSALVERMRHLAPAQGMLVLAPCRPSEPAAGIFELARFFVHIQTRLYPYTAPQPRTTIFVPR
jgi:hypothetical protein